MKSRLNRIYIGFVLGLATPVISLRIYNLVNFKHLSPDEFIHSMVRVGKLSALISLGVLPNLLVFFIFIWLSYLYSARGVLAATLVFAILALITKYFFLS